MFWSTFLFSTNRQTDNYTSVYALWQGEIITNVLHNQYNISYIPKFNYIILTVLIIMHKYEVQCVITNMLQKNIDDSHQCTIQKPF